MPKKVPLVRVGVQRDGQTIFPEINKPFDFEQSEIDDLDALSAKTKVDYYRELIVEGDGEAEAPKAKGKAGKTAKGDEGL